MTMTVDGIEIGHCLYGTEVGIVDYSRKERDTFGNITLIERGYSDLVRYKVEVLTSQVGQIRDLLASKRAVSATYVGDSTLDVTSVTGYLNSFSLSIDDWQHSSLTLEVEGETHG
jgi:hypothetical protein